MLDKNNDPRTPRPNETMHIERWIAYDAEHCEFELCFSEKEAMDWLEKNREYYTGSKYVNTSFVARITQKMEIVDGVTVFNPIDG